MEYSRYENDNFTSSGIDSLWMDNNGNSFMSGKEKEKSKIDFSCSIYSKYPFTKHVPLIICEAVAVPTTIFNIK